eukprot:9492044-Ditylum_brightwellii.AAC.1
MKNILADTNENGPTKKRPKKRRKLCHGNCRRGDDGFNIIYAITRSDKESAEDIVEKTKKDISRELNRIQC